MTPHALLGPSLPAPAGGLQALNSRIRKRQRARFIGTGLALLVLTPLLFEPLKPPSAIDSPGIVIDEGAALAWPASTPDTRIFLVAHAGEPVQTFPVEARLEPGTSPGALPKGPGR